MVTNTEGYIHVIEYLTANLSLFENSTHNVQAKSSVLEVIEQEMSEQIITLCNQNETLAFNQRNTIIREADAIVYDLQEILSGVVNNSVTNEQLAFIKEFTMLIKNLFDTEIHS
ncbi:MULTISPECIES: DUF3802 family protein [unclassified Colwellia]|uniref:DUF3802 family protein n=1 Tax=unclassified Colwellia TaxID=196834 RepID=UPI0015F42D94|nr:MULTISPECIES: DUF3802 family protein [unclassified Colwellia]MBA6288404.1 DUF3802 family protein [Colwellia sp. MB3u-4]MBA6297776.1 DUF3802 family protein [Colwellia sp. MB02u-9]